MSANKQTILVHVIRQDNDDTDYFYRYHTYFAPKIGDEIRIAEKQLYKIKTVVWCLDELDNPYTRLNIGVVPVY
jgi:hypothetical protein